MKVIVFGTRPEFIKILPLIWEINKLKIRKEYYFLFSGQQSQVMSDLIKSFNFVPDETVPYVDHSNSLTESTNYLFSEICSRISLLNKRHKISVIIAQGDTTTCVCTSIVAFLNQIPFAHVEAGLRTNEIQNPWPEEYFRKIISLSTQIHFAPTSISKNNLLHEGVHKSRIVVTGNTIVDFLKASIGKTDINAKKKKQILITLHRRENQSKISFELLDQILKLASEFTEYTFIWVKHHSLEKQNFYLSDSGYSNFMTIAPVPVIDFYKLLSESALVITDSGGIQEECPSFNTPVLVIRKFTERQESVTAGYSILLKNIRKDFRKNFLKLIKTKVVVMKNPYGNGRAAKKIIAVLQKSYSN